MLCNERCFRIDLILLNFEAVLSSDITAADALLVSESTRCRSSCRFPAIRIDIEDCETDFFKDRCVGVSPRAPRAVISVWFDDKDDFVVCIDRLDE